MASITTKPSAVTPTKFEAELAKLDGGILSSIPAGVTLVINGTPMKQQAMDTTVQGYLEKFRAVDPVRQAYRDAVNARTDITVEAREFYKAVRAAIKSYFGNRSPQLASFGIAMDTPRSTTVKQKMVAEAKRTQTRGVRGTRGKKARLAVKAVGDPPVGITSSGELRIGAPPVNVAPTGPASTPAPAGSGSGKGAA